MSSGSTEGTGQGAPMHKSIRPDHAIRIIAGRRQAPHEICTHLLGLDDVDPAPRTPAATACET